MSPGICFICDGDFDGFLLLPALNHHNYCTMNAPMRGEDSHLINDNISYGTVHKRWVEVHKLGLKYFNAGGREMISQLNNLLII